MNKFKHIMLDIETMGNKSHSAIVSIGAVKFDIKTGKTGEEFYVNVDLQSCLDVGLKIDGSTIMWWLKQSDKARKALFENKIPIQDALNLLSNFIDNKNYKVWGNSARFDCGIIEDAYNKLNMRIPWAFWNENDVRTLVSLLSEVKHKCKFKGIPHNAIDDCKHQIKYCSKIWKKLKNLKQKKSL